MLARLSPVVRYRAASDDAKPYAIGAWHLTAHVEFLWRVWDLLEEQWKFLGGELFELVVHDAIIPHDARYQIHS